MPDSNKIVFKWRTIPLIGISFVWQKVLCGTTFMVWNDRKRKMIYANGGKSVPSVSELKNVQS